MKTRYGVSGIAVVLLVIGAAFLVSHSPLATESNVDRRMVNAWAQIGAAKAYYDSKAEWPPHSGYKAFKRNEWDLLQRGWPNGDVRLGALWEAYQARGRMTCYGALDETWANLGPFNHGGRARVVRFHPGSATTMYAGSVSGGLFKSTDTGESWYPMTDQLANLAVGCFEIDALNPLIMYLGTGEGYYNADAVKGIGLLKSTDGGATWNTTGLNYTYAGGYSILTLNIDPRNSQIVLASNNNALYRSTNGGTSFTSVLTGDVKELVRDPQHPDTLLAAPGYPWGSSNNGIFRSTNNGVTWTRSNTGIPTDSLGRTVLAFAPSNSSIVYAGVGSKNTQQTLGIYKSTDNGLNWVQVSPAGTSHYSSQAWYDMTICVKPDDPNTVYSSGLDLYKSTNGGTSWTQLSWWWYSYGNSQFVHADHHDTYFKPGSTTELWEATDGGIFKSTNGGTAWSEKNNGFVTFQYYAMGNATLDTMLAYGGTQDNGTFRYPNSPSHSSVMGGDGGYCVVDYTTNSVIYAETQNGSRARSDNGGSSFSGINSGITGSGAWVTPMLLDPFDHLVLYTTTTNGMVWKSTNQGRSGTWAQLGQTLSTGSMQVLEACPMVAGRLYLGNGSSVYRYESSTATWTNVTGNLPGSWVTRITADPFHPDLVYCTVSGFGTSGHVFQAYGAGGTWTNISGNLPNVPFNDILVDMNTPTTLYAASDIGAYITTNGGTTWQIMGQGLPAARIDDMELQRTSGLLRVATHGRGMWSHPTSRPVFAMTVPNGGEGWVPGDVNTIRWSCGNVHDRVKIEINRNYPTGGWETLDSYALNTGSWAWTVSGAPTTTARIRVTAASNSAIVDISDANFTLGERSVTLSAPNGGEGWGIGVEQTITWSSVGMSENMKLELNRGYPSGAWAVLAASVPNTGSYSWTPTGPATTTARVRIAGVVHTAFGDTSGADFTLGTPFVMVVSPNGGERWVFGEHHTVTWTSAYVPGTVTVEYNLDYPGGSWQTIASGVPIGGSQEWILPSILTTAARVRVRSDAMPALTDVSDYNFEIYSGHTPPVITHDPLHDQTPGLCTVTARVTDVAPTVVTKVFYRLAAASLYDSVTLVETGNPDEVAATFGPLAAGSYRCFLRAVNNYDLATATAEEDFDVGVLWGMETGYDDGTAERYTWVEDEDGIATQWAVKFGPFPTPYVLSGARFGLSRSLPDAGHSPLYFGVYTVGGAGGTPQTLLFDGYTGSIGNVIGGPPVGTNWAETIIRDGAGSPLTISESEFFVVFSNFELGKCEAIGRDTDSPRSHRSFIYDPCLDQWSMEDDSLIANARPGNRLIRISGFPLLPPVAVVHRQDDDIQLHWNRVGAPLYNVYSAASSAGPFTTLVGQTADTVMTDPGAVLAADRRFYEVRSVVP